MNDVVVIGGGAAGLMASAEAAKSGNNVILLEKNDRVGKKLGITGKGRCNVTNDCSIEDFMKNVHTNSRFLYSALTAFPPSATMSFFRSLGVKLKVERGKRVFPESDSAAEIVSALEEYAVKCGVKIIHRRAKHVLVEEGHVVGVETSGETYKCNCALIASGGASYAGTGSDGWGYREAERLGHKVSALRPSLVPLESEQKFCRELKGLSLKNTALVMYNSKGKRVYEDFGELLFTHFGLSGPIILSASMYIKPNEKYYILLDLKPALDEKKLDIRILRDFEKNLNRNVINALYGLMPKSLVPVVLQIAGINSNTKVNVITKVQRQLLIKAIKGMRIDIKQTRPLAEAIITAGGIEVKEINPATMESKLIRGLFFAGEVIDVDACTGGYNLQIAWATAMAAARGMEGYVFGQD